MVRASMMSWSAIRAWWRSGVRDLEPAMEDLVVPGRVVDAVESVDAIVDVPLLSRCDTLHAEDLRRRRDVAVAVAVAVAVTAVIALAQRRRW